MTTREEAAEQLRVIRSMMERATIFRALSGETALVGGAAALGAAWVSENRTGWAWATVWLIGLAAALAFNAWQLYRMAAAKNGRMWTSGLKLALRGAMPSIMAGGFLGLVCVRAGSTSQAACFWILHYGIALLAIREFAPKSMVWLGWAFVIFGVLALAAMINLLGPQVTPVMAYLKNGSRLMAIAFGGFHLIYGAAIVTTGSREESDA